MLSSVKKKTHKKSIRTSRFHLPTRLLPKSIRIILISLITLISLIALILLPLQQAQAAWFDDNYSYRQKLTFVHNAALTQQSMRLTVSNTDTLVTYGKMQSDCDDTRFTDSTGKLLRFKLVSGCNSSSTVYDVVFPSVLNGTNLAFVYYGNPSALSVSDSSIPAGTTPSGTVSFASEEKAPSPQLYLKMDEGYGTTTQDATVYNNDASLTPEDGSSTPVKIDDAGDPGGLANASRPIFRTSSGNLYALFCDGTTLEMWKSVDGTWSEQHAAGHPTCTTGANAGVVDSSDNIHVVYRTSISSIAYALFTTATDTWGTPETVHTGLSAGLYVDVTIDSNDLPHACLWNNDGTTSLRYENKVGGDWNADITISSFASSSCSITINEDNTPEISVINTSSSDILAYVGNVNDATSFTSHTIDSDVSASAGVYHSSIAIDESGNTWVAYVDADGTLNLARHPDASGWTTGWTIAEDTATVREPSITIDGSDVYIFYQDNASNDIVYDIYRNSAFVGPTTLAIGTYQDAKARWSYINSYDSTGVAKVQTNTYYFDGSDAGATDPNNVWTNDANAVDSSTTTVAETSSSGNNTTNFLKSEGTNAPSTGGTIVSVKARMYGTSSAGASISTSIYTDNLAQAIGSAEKTGPSTGWGDYVTLSTPTGGWNWGKIQSLEFKATNTTETVTIEVGKIEVLVQSTNSLSQTEIDYLFSDGTDVYHATLSLAESTEPPTWKSREGCVSGNCLFFDGENDNATVSNANSIDTDKALANGFTISTWVRVNSGGSDGDGRIFEKGDFTYIETVDEGVPGLVTLNASVHLGTANATVFAIDALTLNTWHHVALTYTDDNDDEISLYIDGKVVGTSVDGNGSPASDTYDLLLGGSVTASYHGFIDEFKIYDEERTSTQIKTDFIRFGTPEGASAVLGESDTSYLSNGLLSYWKLDESSGIAIDASGNGVTLTNNGTTTFVSGKFANGSEHLPASSQHFSTVMNIDGIKSVSFWVNPDSTTNYFISLTSSAYITASSGTLSATGFTNPTIFVNGQQSTSISADTWQLITVTTDTAISANQFYVGRQGSNYFDGTMDEVRLYNRALSSYDIRSLSDWAPGAVGWWKLDEKSGQSSNDSSGNDATGRLGSSGSTDTADPVWTQGKYEGGSQFDGSNDYIEFPHTSSLNLDGYTQSYTVEVWVNSTNPSGATTSRIIEKAVGGGASRYPITIQGTQTDDDVVGAIWDGTNVPQVTFGNVWDGRWHHLAFVVNNETDSLYAYTDGVLKDTEVNSVTSSAGNTDVIRIGNGLALDRPYSGKIDDVRLYNYARNAKQILSSMNADHPLVGTPVGSPVGHWSFDEGYGITANDKTPHDNDLTLSSASWTNNGKFGKALNAASQAAVSYRSDDNDFDFSSTESFSISTWIKSRIATNPAAPFYIISKYDAGGYSLYINTSGQVVCGIDDNNSSFPRDSTSSSADYYDATWHHIVCTLDRATGTLSLYVDGRLSHSSLLSGTYSIANNFFLSVGGFEDTPNFDSFDGYIDETKIYRAALNVDQIKIEFSQGKAQVFGAASTASDGITADKSASREYCPPGNTETNCGNGDPSPVGEWKMDDGTGTNAHDSSGNGRTGTLTNNPYWLPGKMVNGLGMNGSNSYVDIGTGPSSVKTVTFWVYPTTTTEYFINLTSTTDYIWVNNGTITATGLASPTIYVNGINSTTLVANRWQHVAVITNTAENASNLDIGRTQDTNYLEGKIDQVRLFDYALTQSQVAWDYNRGGPVGWWKFDECQGTTAYDATGNGNNGTISITSGSQSSAGTCNSGSSSEAWNNGTSGKFNSSLSLDSDQDIVTVSDGAIFDITEGFTLSAWIQKTGGSSTQVISKTNAFASGGYGMLTGGAGEVYCRTSNGVTYADSYTSDGLVLEETGWHHVVAVRSGSTCRIYVDGTDRTTVADDHSTVTTNALDVKIGGQPDNTQLFNGKIDDARIYNYALSSQQIKLLYNENAAVRFGPNTGAP